MIWLRGFVLTPLLFIHRGHCHLHCQSGRWPHPQREVDEGEVEADHTRWPHLHRAEGPGVQTGDQRGDQVWLGSVQVRRLQQAWRDRVQHRHARGWKERLCDARGRSESQAEEVSFSDRVRCFFRVIISRQLLISELLFSGHHRSRKVQRRRRTSTLLSCWGTWTLKNMRNTPGCTESPTTEACCRPSSSWRRRKLKKVEDR